MVANMSFADHSIVQTPAWPECSILSGSDGAPAIVVNGQPLPPILFAGNNQFNRDEVLLEQLRLAAQAGTPFFVIEYSLEWSRSDEEVLELISKFRAAHPKGYFFLRIWMNPNREWLNQNPDERIQKSDGTITNFVAPASQKWLAEAGEQLRKRIELLLDSPHGEYFIGAAPMHLNTAEWFYPEANDFMDYSPANLQGFRVWLKDKYGDTITLQQAWGDDSISLNTVEIPTPEQRTATAPGMGLFRDPVLHRPAMDLQQYQSEKIVDAILYFARVIKDTTHRRALAGSFYGYLMEINNNGPRALAHSGHLALGKLLESPDIDILMAPYSYFQRSLGEPGNLHLPADSVALHGKLLIVEEDTFTHMAMEPAEGLIAPGWRERTHSANETLAIAQRNVANFLMHGAGVWFFDLLSDGRWNDPDFWQKTSLFHDMVYSLWNSPYYTPEIVFVMDELSVHTLGANTYPLLNNSLSHWRAELSRVGAPVGYYLQSDLMRLPSSTRLIILANAYKLSNEETQWLDAYVEAGGVVLYTHAAGMINDSQFNTTQMTELSGMPVLQMKNPVPVHLQVEGEDVVHNIDNNSWEPGFYIDLSENLQESSNIEILCRYAENDEISAAVRAHGEGRIAYTATPRLPVSALQRLCDLAGVHRFRDTPGMVGIVGAYLIVHMEISDVPQPIRLSMPGILRDVHRVAPSVEGMEIEIINGITTWSDTLLGGATGIYQVKHD